MGLYGNIIYEDLNNRQKLEEEINQRESAIEALEMAIATEETERIEADLALETRISAYEGAKDSYALKSELQAGLNGIKEELLGDDLEETFNTLKSVQDWVNTHGETVDGIITDFETEITNLQTSDNSLDLRIQDYEKVKNTLATKAEAQSYADSKNDIITAAQNRADSAYTLASEKATIADVEAKGYAVATQVADEISRVKAIAEAATTVEEVNSQIDTKITDLNLGETYEPIGAENRAKAYVDDKFIDANLAQYTTEQEVKDIIDDVIANAADEETYNSLTKLVDYIDTHGGEVEGILKSIEDLQNLPGSNISNNDIINWNNEIGGKSLAETIDKKVDVQKVSQAISEAENNNKAYTDSEIDKASQIINSSIQNLSNQTDVRLVELENIDHEAYKAEDKKLETQIKTISDDYLTSYDKAEIRRNIKDTAATANTALKKINELLLFNENKDALLDILNSLQTFLNEGDKVSILLGRLYDLEEALYSGNLIIGEVDDPTPIPTEAILKVYYDGGEIKPKPEEETE